MKVITPSGRQATWSFQGCRVLGDQTRPRSTLHVRARAVLKAVFPSEVVYEEVPVPGTRLRLDFLIPKLRLAVEVQGRQHAEYVPHFHKSKAEFLNALGRDRAKADFCEANGVTLVCLGHGGTDSEWGRAVADAASEG